jgi:hypothetical protein
MDQDLKIRLGLTPFVLNIILIVRFKGYHDDHGENRYWILKWCGNILVLPHFTLFCYYGYLYPKQGF